MLDVKTASISEPLFTVMVPRYGLEGCVRLSKIAGDDECLVRDPEKHRLDYKDAESGKILASVAVFDKVRVSIWVRSSRDNQKELVIDLLEPKILADPAHKNVQHAEEKVSLNSKADKKKKKKRK